MSLIVDLDAIDAKRTYLQTVSRRMKMARWLEPDTEWRFQRTLTPALRCVLRQHRRLMALIMASPVQH
jgi:hypothetical protein